MSSSSTTSCSPRTDPPSMRTTMGGIVVLLPDPAG
jgi:hypothetical protein